MILRKLSIRELLMLYAEAIEELRRRKVVRTANNPIGDYTEWLVSNVLGLRTVQNSAAGYDAETKMGVRVQIKGRRVTKRSRSTQLSPIRNLADKNFDEMVAVIFDEDYGIKEAILIPHEVVTEYGVYRQHVNGHILHIRGKLLEDPRVRTIRKELIEGSKL